MLQLERVLELFTDAVSSHSRESWRDNRECFQFSELGLDIYVKGCARVDLGVVQLAEKLIAYDYPDSYFGCAVEDKNRKVAVKILHGVNLDSGSAARESVESLLRNGFDTHLGMFDPERSPIQALFVLVRGAATKDAQTWLAAHGILVVRVSTESDAALIFAQLQQLNRAAEVELFKRIARDDHHTATDCNAARTLLQRTAREGDDANPKATHEVPACRRLG